MVSRKTTGRYVEKTGATRLRVAPPSRVDHCADQEGGGSMRTNLQTALRNVCEAIEGKKGDNLTILDVSRISTFADIFVICNGHNDKQNRSICDEILSKLKKDEHRSPTHVEGYQWAEWILMDYHDIVVHIFSARTRAFYNLEKLWSDGVEVKPEPAGPLTS